MNVLVSDNLMVRAADDRLRIVVVHGRPMGFGHVAMSMRADLLCREYVGTDYERSGP
jgi:hypothetical protein